MDFINHKNKKDLLKRIGNISQIAGTKHYNFADGKAKGTEAFDVRTGSGLEFTVLPGRGMDIAWMSYKGIPLNYMSKSGIVAAPFYDGKGMNWLRGFFAGMLTTCGLMNVGGPESVKHPIIGDRDLGLHGNITHCVAEQVSCYEDWEGEEYVIKLSGLMRDGFLHCESLTLRREITAKLFSNSITIKDTVTNHSQNEEPVMLMYHINAGYPLLDENSVFYADSKDIDSANDIAKANISTVYQCSKPIYGLEEYCYAHDLREDENGMVHVALVNPDLNIGFAISYLKEELPCFNQWKMFGEQEYVLGMEPGNSLPRGREYAKKTGKWDVLQPEETKTYELTLTVLDGRDECNAFVNKNIGKKGG